MEKIRVCFLGGGPAFPRSIPFKDKFKAFSKIFSCCVVTPVAGINSRRVTDVSDVRIYQFPYIAKNSIARNVYTCFQLINIGIKTFKERGYDVIVSPNPLMSGLAGTILARITSTKLIVEVNGNFESAFKYGRLGEAEVSFLAYFKEFVAQYMIKYILKRADVVKLVHSKQLDSLKIDKDKVQTVVFPNFVPIKQFLAHEKRDGKYILLLGFPWYLKGVDILIKAFNQISGEFPEYSLKIVGWCPKGRDFFEELAKGNEKNELLDAVEYEEVIELMTSCSVYVLASRTDSSPRVLREAMASKKPIIASNIDGVPELIEDGFNGLLFESKNVQDLAKKLSMVLSNPTLAKKLAKSGYEYVQEKLSEEVYLKNYMYMVENVLSN